FVKTMNKGGSQKMSIIQKIALVFTIVGGIAWALVGIFNFNIVTWLFQEGSVLTRIVYIFIGICALFNIVALFLPNRHHLMEE
ncbi:MAG: DUF378 domain-containing protein, partial [Anaeroplasmataceae bacterium]|nr:DUF378 domain-containing protein [Anaeroplasmataceae bacterium]